jgi:hypothetical protein
MYQSTAPLLSLPVKVSGRSSQEVAGWSSEIDSGTAAAVLDGFDGVAVGVCAAVCVGVEVGVGGVVVGVITGVVAVVGVLVIGGDGSGSANAAVGINPISNVAATAAAPTVRKRMASSPSEEARVAPATYSDASTTEDVTL